ncbi:MAG: GAF domain-containing protein [Chloroflexi bacterium]|nr:GAF domain-containing protein [Chloroflexota bacterium]
MLSNFFNRHLVTIRARLILALVLIGLLSGTGFIVVTTIADFGAHQRISIEKLEAVTTLKHAETDYWVKNILTNLTMLFTETNMTGFAEIVSTQSSLSPEFREAYEHIQDDFQHILVRQTPFFDDVFLIDLHGRIVLSTNASQEGTFVNEQDYFREGSQRDFIAVLSPTLTKNTHSFIAAHPIVDQRGRKICVIAGLVKLASLDEIMTEYAGLGETGKTYLVDSNYTMITDSRFAVPHAQPGGTLFINTEGVRATLISQTDDWRLALDYRDVPVIGVYHWLSDLKVVLVAEQDQAEAFSSAFWSLKINFLISSVLLLVSIIVALRIIRDITAPLSDLAKTAAQITEGNLDLVASVERRDEIGAVAQAFNTMTTRLRELIQRLQVQVAELERAQSERDHAEARTRYLASFPQLNPNPVIEVNYAGKITFSNPATQTILKNLGADPHAAHLFMPADINDILNALNQTSPTPFNREVTIKDRVFGEKLAFAAPMNAVRIYAYDITDRRRAEDQLRQLSYAVEQSPASIIVTDIAGDIDYVNPKFTEVTGYAFEEVRGKNPRILRSGKTPPRVYEELWKTITAGKEWHGELLNKKKSGELYWESVSISPINDSHGKLNHYVAVKEDITVRHKMEEALRAARDELDVRVRERTTELENAIKLLKDEIAERKRVEELIRQNVVRSETLTRVATQLNAQLGLETILNAVCEESARALNAPVTTLSLYNPDRDEIAPASSFGLPRDARERLRPIPRAEYEASAKPSGSLNIIPDAQTLQDPRSANWYVEFDIRAATHARLEYDGNLVGVLSIFTTGTARQFDENELALLRGLARQAAQAITNARLYKAESTARQVAETLTVASLALTQSLNLDIVLETLLDSVMRLVPYDSANVMLLDADSQLTVRAMRGYEKWTTSELTRLLKFDARTNPILKDLLTTRQSVLIADTEKHPGWERPVGAEHVRNWLGVPLIAGGNVVGLYSLDKTQPGFFTQAHRAWVEALAAQAAVAIQNAWLFEQLRADRERLELLSRRLVEVQETERRYIARELHDEAGQLLAGLKLGLRVLERESGASKPLVRQVAELRRVVDEVLANLHRLAMHLRPATLDQLGLVAAMREHVEEVSAKYALAIEFETVGMESARLPSTTETALYRIVQEALTNIIRHARATRVQIILERRDDCVRATVDDDGCGFDVQEATQRGRLGLLGMKERVDMLGGKLTVESEPGEGTTLIIEVPNGDSNSDRG